MAARSYAGLGCDRCIAEERPCFRNHPHCKRRVSGSELEEFTNPSSEEIARMLKDAEQGGCDTHRIFCA